MTGDVAIRNTSCSAPPSTSLMITALTDRQTSRQLDELTGRNLPQYGKLGEC